MKKSNIPTRTRRLTKVEAARLGVSHKAKRRVNADVKRVTKSTKLFTDRQVAEAKKGVSREAFAKSRVQRRNLKTGGVAIEYKDLTKPNLIKLLRRYKDREVLLKFHGTPGSRQAEYKGRDISTTNDEEWFSAPARTDAWELLDPDTFEDYLDQSGVSGSLKFGMIVY